MTHTYSWTTAGVIRETENTVTVMFNTGDEPFLYQPGQFINITLPINGQPVTRSYSLSSSPDTDELPAITVKRVAGGVMSSYIVNSVAAIREWQVSGPYGSFTPAVTTFAQQQVVLLAGGSGIAPLFSIARTLLTRSPAVRVAIIYSSRSEQEIIFRQPLQEWQEQYGDRISIHHALSDAGSEISAGNWSRGRISREVTRNLLKQVTAMPHHDVHYFICGPANLMNMHRETLDALEVPPAHVFMEWFTPEEPATGNTLPDTTQEVLLHYYEQSNLLEVKPGESILEAALQDHIGLRYSCRGGTCGLCAARLTSGKVKMIHTHALHPEDLEQGMVLLCQSYPLTGDVTVEIG